jgi:hypothetical protein
VTCDPCCSPTASSPGAAPTQPETLHWRHQHPPLDLEFI